MQALTFCIHVDSTDHTLSTPGCICKQSCLGMQLELGEARGQLRAAKAASHAAYERVEMLTAQLAAMEAGSPLGLIFRPFRVGLAASSPAMHSRLCHA